MIAKDFALEVKTPAAAAALHADPEMGFIRGYVHGEIEVHCAPPYHLGYALDFAEQGAPQAFGARIRQTLSRGQWWLHQVFRPYGPGQAAKDMAAHYDLDFPYALMLDPERIYTAGYFTDNPGRTLAEAQQAKLGLVLQRVGLPARVQQGTATLLDIGCGAGALVVAAARAGAKAYGVTLSQAHARFAAARLAEVPFDRARVAYTDWRQMPPDFPSAFDMIAGIEVLEHQGKAARALIRFCWDHLKPGGSVVLQTIMDPGPVPGRLRHHPPIGHPFLQGEIFPGGRITRLWETLDWARRVGFRLLGYEAFGASYARTLALWCENLARQQPAVLAAMQDPGRMERFRTMWLYLHLCQRLFERGDLTVGQLLWSKGKPLHAESRQGHNLG